MFKKIRGKLYNNYKEKINWLEILEMKFTYPKEKNQCTDFIACLSQLKIEIVQMKLFRKIKEVMEYTRE